tara:strand:+ start:268 stop:978 length:711 start_codon:yes stop_codon:yes gene_type:complete
MIISYSQNFAVIRAPKTGSTSLVFYFFKSGLLDNKQDIYSVEGPYLTWQELENEYKEHGLKRRIGQDIPRGNKKFQDVHLTFNEMCQQELIRPNTPCVGTIRNPLERVASAYNYPKFFLQNVKSTVGDPNQYWDNIKEEIKDQGKVFSFRSKLLKPQCEYFPSHARLFNTENLHEHVKKYILNKGGKVNKRIEMRKNFNNNIGQFLSKLTGHRKQDILDTYAKDYALWEKAYAVCN